MTRIITAIGILILSASLLSAQSVTGLWKTIDDETGKAKSEVEITIKNGKLYGKIVKLYRAKGEDQDPVCTVCPGSRKGKKVVGMTIITALDKDGSEWEADDAILDPKTGEIYDCKVWLDESNKNILYVRGYIGFLYRTQTWHRIK
jgi:uncharacterized protein (DUF2147 family)